MSEMLVVETSLAYHSFINCQC